MGCSLEMKAKTGRDFITELRMKMKMNWTDADTDLTRSRARPRGIIEDDREGGFRYYQVTCSASHNRILICVCRGGGTWLDERWDGQQKSDLLGIVRFPSTFVPAHLFTSMVAHKSMFYRTMKSRLAK